jgi:glycine/D-amino acid oxidase-like deaminating enzyme
VNVPEIVEAMWLSAERKGARLTMRRARAIAPGHGTVRVETTDGPLDAPHVVLAAGCWAGQIDLADVPPLPVRPVRGQLVSLGLAAVPVAQALWGPGCYLVPWDDGTLLVVAADREGSLAPEHATLGGVASLLHAAPRLLPAAALATFAGVRVASGQARRTADPSLAGRPESTAWSMQPDTTATARCLRPSPPSSSPTSSRPRARPGTGAVRAIALGEH